VPGLHERQLMLETAASSPEYVPTRPQKMCQSHKNEKTYFIKIKFTLNLRTYAAMAIISARNAS